MEQIRLVRPTLADTAAIAAYRAEFLPGRMQVTADPDRIPGLDHLEEYPSVADWLRWCGTMRDKTSWFLSVRCGDQQLVGCLCLRHRLEYDDDDPEFASHIGYSVRPSLQGRGYGREQLRLALQEAGKLGLSSVRLICRDINTASSRVILANGGRLVDTLHGEQSGLTVCRYDIAIPEDRT